MILGLFPQLLGAGGIERVGRHTAAVLTSFARAQNLSCHLLSLNDPPGRHTLQGGDFAFTIRGFGRRKSRFVLSMLAAAPQTRLAYIAHPNLAPLGLLLRLLRPSACYCVATHGIEVWQPLLLHRKLGVRFARVVTAPSQYTAEKLIVAQKLNPSKVTVLAWALDQRFAGVDGAMTRRKPSIPSGRLLLTVARLAASEQYKGVETVIQALPKVLRVVPQTCYVIVGDGDDRLRLERLATDMGLAGHVLFAGGTTDDELVSYYAASDIFVMPSRAEGFGVVFLEAMAFGKPVIGGNHGGTPEVVVDGVTGFLAEHGDVDALGDRLIRLLRDGELRKRMGEAGQQLVGEHYTFDHFRQRLVKLLAGCAS